MYIERFNGNIAARNNDYRQAIQHYNKALFGLKCIFDSNREQNFLTQEAAVKILTEIEIPVCRNLAQCYLSTEDYHFAIKYAQ